MEVNITMDSTKERENAILDAGDLVEARDLKKLSARADQAQEARLELGRRLITARRKWGKTGKAARGWEAFLKAAGIEKRSAQRYMAAARRADTIRDSLSRKPKPTLIERTLKLVAQLDDHGRQMVLEALSAAPVITNPTGDAQLQLPFAKPAQQVPSTDPSPASVDADDPAPAANDNQPARGECSIKHLKIRDEQGQDCAPHESRAGCACADSSESAA
jgi:hypothetical protein